MTRAHLTPLRRFALLSRWRAKLAEEDGQPHDVEHIPSGWPGYLDTQDTGDLSAANDERALPMDVEPASRTSLAMFFAAPVLLAAIAAATLVLDRCTA